MDEKTRTGEADFPAGGKDTTNILRLMAKCGLLVPTEHGTSIIGLDRTLSTRHAVPALLRMLSEKLRPHDVAPAPGVEVPFALGLGVNHWLNLSPYEFEAAATQDLNQAQPQSARQPIPDELVELSNLLNRRRQVVLQGPPGVGKTYLARRYVTWATAGRSDDGRLQAILAELPANERRPADIAAEIMRRGLPTVWDIVQFHPGYDYTDFVRALVAEPVAGGVTFTPRHKLFSFMAAVGQELARQGSSVDQVLILDEVNRGDIANIFGELLYALEYRDEPVATPYTVDGQAAITVPARLFLIGTMNTADRSIAVIDYALRRRFVFLDLPSTPAPIASYSHYPSDTVKQAALRLWQLTDETLANSSPGLRVGPSYFLVDETATAAGLEALAGRYVYEVLPLLREYELEGELDPTSLIELTSTLGLEDKVPQQQMVAALAKRLLNDGDDSTVPLASDSGLTASAGGDEPDESQDEPQT